MELYILRHGIAIPRGTRGYPDDDRPLTPAGNARMGKNAKGIAAAVSGCDCILTSPMKRAAQTAKIVSQVLHPTGGITVLPALLPGTPTADLIAALAKVRKGERLIVVGHEPDLGLLASLLLGAKGSFMEFKKGGICRIDIASIPPHRPGKLIWHLTPKQLRLLGKKSSSPVTSC